MFGSAPFGSTASTIGGKAPLALNLGTLQNPMKDVEVTSPPDDSVSAMKFSPKANFLVASSWSNDVCYIYIYANISYITLFKFGYQLILCTNKILCL